MADAGGGDEIRLAGVTLDTTGVDQGVKRSLDALSSLDAANQQSAKKFQETAQAQSKAAAAATDVSESVKRVTTATKQAAQATQDYARLTQSEIQKAAKWFDEQYAAVINAKNGQVELNRTIAAELTELAQVARQVDITKAKEIERFQQTAAASKEFLVSQNANAQQMLRFDGIMQSVNMRTERLGERGAHSLKMMATNMAVLAAGAGQSVRSFDSLLANASLLAFSFGPEGQLAAAVTITGSVILRQLHSWISGIEAMRAAAKQAMDKLIFDANSAETRGALQQKQFQVYEANEAIDAAKETLANMVAERTRVFNSILPGEAGDRARQGAITGVTDAQDALNTAIAKRNELGAEANTLAKVAADQYRNEAESEQFLARVKKDHNDQLQRETDLARFRAEQLKAANAEETKLEQGMSKFAQSVDAQMQAQLQKLAARGMPTVNPKAKAGEPGSIISATDLTRMTAGITATGAQLDKIFGPQIAEAKRWQQAWHAALQQTEGDFSSFMTNLLEGKVASFRDFTRQILELWLQMLVKMEVANAATKAGAFLASLLPGGGAASAAASATGSISPVAMAGNVAHGGGVVGSDLVRSRMLPASVFAGAPRFHSGLFADEVPTILQRGESVLTPAQMRAVASAGSGGGMTVHQEIHFNVQAMDSRDVTRMLKEQKGTIAGVVLDAVQGSSQFRKQLTGA